MAFVNPVLPYLYSITLLGPLNMEMTLADRVDKVIHIIHLEVHVFFFKKLFIRVQNMYMKAWLQLCYYNITRF